MTDTQNKKHYLGKTLSVRLDQDDHQRLGEITRRVNEHLQKRKLVSESKIIRALLAEGECMDTDKIVDRIKELI